MVVESVTINGNESFMLNEGRMYASSVRVYHHSVELVKGVDYIFDKSLPLYDLFGYVMDYQIRGITFMCNLPTNSLCHISFSLIPIEELQEEVCQDNRSALLDYYKELTDGTPYELISDTKYVKPKSHLKPRRFT